MPERNMKFATFYRSHTRQRKVLHAMKNGGLSLLQQNRLEALRDALGRRMGYALIGPVQRRQTV
jgi:hypothetical protein